MFLDQSTFILFHFHENKKIFQRAKEVSISLQPTTSRNRLFHRHVVEGVSTRNMKELQGTRIVIILTVLFYKTSALNQYEYSRQLREHVQERWQYQLEHEREDHEQQQESIEDNHENYLKHVTDGNTKIQEGDENFHETFESNREKGTIGKSFSSKRTAIDKKQGSLTYTDLVNSIIT